MKASGSTDLFCTTVRNASSYPRPAFRREPWIDLDGTWDFAFDPNARANVPQEIVWDRTIQVPFAPETPASGLGNQDLYCAVWYRRSFPTPKLKAGERLCLHFGAVDYDAAVWVNGVKVCEHEGGYTPFSVEIQDALRPGETQEVAVRAFDDPADLEKPRGKQDWKKEPHSIWYPRTTGIWQTVWLEIVPQVYIASARLNANLTRWEIDLTVQTLGPLPHGASLSVTMQCGSQVLAQDQYAFVAQASNAGSLAAGEIHRSIALSDPGIDDFRNELLWSPDNPTLIDVVLELRESGGRTVDSVKTYTALRSIGIQGDRFVLNGRPLQLRLVLDQGYWPESGLTAPDDEAFQRDILLIKQLGFNGVRKHQKLEDPRFLYWADQLGLLVWEEMPSAYRYTQRSIERVTREWAAAVERDSNHPCIVAWVPLNESWGVPDLPDSPAQRHYVQALYHLTKTLDPQRPVIGNDGWESIATDIIGIHDYDSNPEAIGRRYGISEVEHHLFEFERPGGRILKLGSKGDERQPIVLTEFGGIALRSADDPTWGYTDAHTLDEFAERYTRLLEVVRSLSALAGFCYTQFTDTYQEANGILHADRSEKVPSSVVAEATTGRQHQLHSNPSEQRWRERLMHLQAKT